MTWKNELKDTYKDIKITYLEKHLDNEENSGKIIYPPKNLRYAALTKTPLENLKVVILGQDPYPQPNNAMGLSFSVPKTQKIPGSLKNIYKELNSDFNKEVAFKHGDLTSWAQQGVLLLNTSLSVEANNVDSHRHLDWHVFTDKVIKTVSEKKENVVFILWGSKAKQKSKFIDSNKHLILESAHPSGLSAYRGFWGSKPFSKTNNYLVKNNKLPIDWYKL